MHAAVHGAKIGIEVLVEPVVSIEGKGLETAAASAMRSGRATRLRAGAVGVLSIAVVSRRQVEVRNDGVANAGPIHLHRLRFVEGVVGNERQHIIPYVVESSAERSTGIGVLDMLVAGKELERLQLVQRHEGIRRIVRDGCRQGV